MAWVHLSGRLELVVPKFCFVELSKAIEAECCLVIVALLVKSLIIFVQHAIKRKQFKLSIFVLNLFVKVALSILCLHKLSGLVVRIFLYTLNQSLSLVQEWVVLIDRSF